jgi:hypothetical protein
LLIYLKERSSSSTVVLTSNAASISSPVHSEISTAFAIVVTSTSLATARSMRSCKSSKLIELLSSAAIAT